MKSTATRWLLPVLVFCLLPVADSAGQGTTASMSGTVVDENENPLPGVNVVAVHQPTGTRYGVATGTNGRFRIQGMRVGGPYTVTASFVGYQTTRREEIQLQLDETRELNFQLEPQTAQMEEVEVIGQSSGAVIDKNRTGAATNISAEEIDELPTIGRSLTDFARLVPQATGSGSFGSANSRYNSIQVDGATLDDVFGLGDAVPGSQAGAEPISLDAIQELNVNIAPYSVTQSGFTGGQVNAITKSGSNQFKGSFRFKGGTEKFTGDLDGVGTGEFSQAFFTGTLGGPIVEDELFFFISGELKRESSPIDTRVGQNLSGENVFDESPQTLTNIRDVFRDTYGFDPGGTEPLTDRQDDEKLLVKLDWNINQNHRLTLRNNYVSARDDQGIGRGENSFSFERRGYVFRSTQNSATAQLNSTIGDNMFNEARLVYTRIRDERDVQAAAFPETTLQLDSGNDVVAGIDRFSQANRLDQDLFEFTNDFTYTRGDHTFTVGTNNKYYQFENLFIQDFFGSYTFEPFEYENASGETVEVSAIEALNRGQPTEYQYSYATQAAGTNQPAAEFSAFQLGGYVQDEWQVLPELRLTLGLRLDVPVLPDEPTFNPTAFEAFGRSTTDIASGNLLWAPRLGFNYDRGFFGDDLSTQIRGGVGIFSGDPPFVWISNQYSNTGADVNRIDANFTPSEDFVGDEGNYSSDARLFPEGAADAPTQQPLPAEAPFCQENPGDSRCSELLAPQQTTAVNFVSDDFKYPQTFRTNLAVDQELPGGFTTTLEAIYSTTINNVTFRNINIEKTQESRYGRPLYGEPGGDPNRVSDRFTNAIVLDNTNDGYQYSITGQIQRQVREGLTGSLSYTYNRAENVNNGTSSRAVSNWNDISKDVNNPRLGTAANELRHRILGTLNYRLAYADRFQSTIGLVYEGRSGSPFDWIYNGDANGDGEQFNDLLYVPETQRDVVLESSNWEQMNAFIEGVEALDEARGSVIRRNTDRAPWQNRLDLRFAQTIETLKGQNIQFTVDITNFLNMLNEDWGLQRTTQFGNVDAWNLNGYVQPEDVGASVNGRVLTEDDVGKPRVTFNEDPTGDIVEDRLSNEFFDAGSVFSRWRVRLGVKYTF
ncbi:TonB-dependent receptor [Salinibacter ruber]|uniref:TonB-dependent receptor n=1 Tax=Salinibacter ruber TaxID=146919 RepID=UPI0021683841|nr:carboxypeptidase regulatory-like domain-containing protein [Salinibacter ruber]MCS3757441.1 hypothetical protein [Salinibacter ruber]MCS3956300.1 hypothetical protein [Salinibacter ruber]